MLKMWHLSAREFKIRHNEKEMGCVQGMELWSNIWYLGSKNVVQQVNTVLRQVDIV